MANSTDEDSSKLYDSYTGINKVILRAVGLWPRDDGKDPFYLRTLALIYLCHFVCLTLTHFYHVYLLWGDFFECLEVLCNTTTAFFIAERAAVFIYKRRTIVEFEAQSRKMWIAAFQDLNNREMMISVASNARKLTNFFIGLVILCLTNFFLAPLVSVLYQWNEGVPDDEMIFVLPYLLKFPCDLHNPVNYVLSYVPCAIITVCIVYWIIGVDSFYFVWIQHTTLYLKLLRRSIRRSGQLLNLQGSNSALRNIRACIVQHNSIMRQCELLEEIYGPIILGLCVLNTFSMCMVIFHTIITKGGHNGNLFLFLTYLSMEVFEALLYCWFGNTLTEESLSITLAAYDIDWYEDRPEKLPFCNCIKIMMMRSQKPITLTAYKFAKVSLELFTNIMSSTFSYFTLLKTLYND